VQKGSFPALMLAPVNFDALYAQSIATQAAQAEAGETAQVEEATAAPEQTH
jgi:preprotein translocase subunit SecB